MRTAKLLGVLFTLLLLLGVFVPGASAALAPEVTPGPMDGDWYLQYTWEGSPTGSAWWYIDAGMIVGTFESSDSGGGYTLFIPRQGKVFLKYCDGAFYQGTINSAYDYMSGTMMSTSGYRGIWEAWKGGFLTTDKLPHSGRNSAGN